MHEVLVNHLGGLSLPRKGVVRLTDHPDMTLDVYRGRKTTIQQQQIQTSWTFETRWVVVVQLSRAHWDLLFITVINPFIHNNETRDVEIPLKPGSACLKSKK